MALLLSSLTVKTNKYNKKGSDPHKKSVVATVFLYSLFFYFFIGIFRDKMTLREWRKGFSNDRVYT